MTSRLRELELEFKARQSCRVPIIMWYAVSNLLMGYKMALEDLKPVLDAAEQVAKGKSPANQGNCCSSCELRTALDKLEDPDA